ncbi:MAG: hypothetical protein K2I42_03635 [Anaeroplasmataceae bacterium]|nr:hypothetical protein [Anaeroplasmataceae bacterium]
MKKIGLFFILFIITLICSSCSSKVSKADFIKQISDIEKSVENYQYSIPKDTPKSTISWTISNENSKEIFEYEFTFTKYTIEEQRYHAVVILKSDWLDDKSTHWHEYFIDTQTYRSRTLDFIMEETAMQYEEFYSMFVIEEFHSLNLDMSKIKEYSFKENGGLTPSADSKIIFEEDYHFIIDNDYLKLDLSNLTGEANYSYLNGYELLSLRCTGKTTTNSIYTIHWNFVNM